MNRLSSLLAFLMVTASAISTPLAGAASLRADHPLLGTWKISLPDGACYEIYRIRGDGSTLVTSAEEIAESELELSDQPSEKGFYKWIDKITKDNGKKDCSGDITEPGHVATNFIRMHPRGNMFLMCQKEDLDTCIGPFVRIKGTDT